MQTRQQVRAQKAYKAISSVKGTESCEEYGRVCVQFPVLLHSCGLCQAVAFYEAKREKAYTWFLDRIFEDVTGKAKRNDDIFTAKVQEYMRLTREVLATAAWYKRYAEAMLKPKTGAESSTKGGR